MKLKYMKPMPALWWQISGRHQVDILYIPGCVCRIPFLEVSLEFTWILQENGKKWPKGHLSDR